MPQDPFASIAVPTSAAPTAASSSSAGSPPTTTAPQDPFAAIATPVSAPDQGAVGTMGASGAMGAMGIMANPLTIGAAKGVGETAHTIGRLINYATGDKITWLPSSLKQP